MKRIEIRGVIAPSSCDQEWYKDLIAKGMITPENRIREALATAGDDVELYINSRGGSVFSGNEIVNALKTFKATGKRLEITVGAMAASMAANIVAMAGADRVKAFSNAKFMFHGAIGGTEGGKGAHEDSAALLDSVNADVVATLTALPKAKKSEVKGWFEEGRAGWLSAKQALDMGLIHEIVDATDAPLASLEKDAAQKMLEAGFDVAALDFEEPVENVTRAEFDTLMARFTGLQSAKDREIAALGTTHTEAITALKSDHLNALAGKDNEIVALKAQVTDFTAKLATAAEEFGKVTASLNAEQGAHATTKATLVTTDKQLTDAKAKHAALVGDVLGGSPDGKKAGSGPTGLARVIAAEKADTEKEGK